MPYINISRATTGYAEAYVYKNWVDSTETTLVNKHILSRAAYLILTPASFVTSALDTLVGLGVTIGTILSGRNKKVFDFTMLHLDSTNKLALRPYANFLKTINPEACFTKGLEDIPYNESYVDRRLISAAQSLGFHYQEPKISAKGDGFVSDLVIEPLKGVARRCYKSENFLKRHVASRLTYILLAISCVVTRAVDGVIALPAAVLSILTVGKIQSLNNLAYRTLQATGIISDLAYCIIKIVNPLSGTAL